jgi:hypothetical protein
MAARGRVESILKLDRAERRSADESDDQRANQQEGYLPLRASAPVPGRASLAGVRCLLWGSRVIPDLDLKTRSPAYKIDKFPSSSEDPGRNTEQGYSHPARLPLHRQRGGAPADLLERHGHALKFLRAQF